MHTIVFTMETENTHLFGKDPQIGWICPDAKRLTNQTKQWMKLTNKNHNFFGRRKLLLDFASWLRAEIQLSDRQWGVKLHVTRKNGGINIKILHVTLDYSSDRNDKHGLTSLHEELL